MKLYEMTYIARQEGDPGVVAAIGDADGSITSERTMGRRQFAYPIGKETAGYYTTLRFTAPAETLADLNRVLNLNTGVVRFLLVEVPELKLEAVDLDVEDLKEAKELEAEAETAPADAAAPVDTKRLDEQLQAGLDKLLGETDEAIK